MSISNIPLAQLVIQSLKNWNINQIVISPGSRNAPLTISFTEDDYFECYSIVDERSAAFFALGVAQKTMKPVVLTCTSGSALLNYYPAIAEAFYSCIPLIVLSADRPSYGIDIGDGQTIRQYEVYKNHIAKSQNLIQDRREDKHQVLLKKISKIDNRFDRNENLSQKQIELHNIRALDEALQIVHKENQPVHCNLPFEEPLYEIAKTPFSYTLPRPNIESKQVVCKDDLKVLSESIKGAKSIMILVGVLAPFTLDQDLLQSIADIKSIVLLTETTSNVRNQHGIESIDQIIAPIELSEDRELFLDDLKPDLLITMGGMLISKKIKAFLREYRATHHFHFGQTIANDTFYLGVKHIKGSENDILRAVQLDLLKEGSKSFKFKWLRLKNKLNQAKLSYMQNVPWCDFKVFSILSQAIPSNINLNYSNSSAIRYAQLFPMKDGQKVFCNRGTSGIDGSTSTSIGHAVKSKSANLLITGDLSFLYDSNALWNNYIPNDFRIIVVNNGGGGIFRILPANKENENFSTFFETKHDLSANSLCEMFDFDYHGVKEEVALVECFGRFFKLSKRPQLLEVFTPNTVNDQVLLGYFEYLSKYL